MKEGLNAAACNIKSTSPSLGNVERNRDHAGSRHTLNLDKPRAFSLDLDKGTLPQTGVPCSTESGRRRAGSSRGAPPHHAPTKVMIIWLESFEDNLSIPLGELVQSALLEEKKPSYVYVLFIFSHFCTIAFAGDLLAYTGTGLEVLSVPNVPNDTVHSHERDCFVIYLHALPSGLLRVKLQGPQGRYVLEHFLFNLY